LIEVWHIDEPAGGALVQKHSFSLTGWVHADSVASVAEIVVMSGTRELGSSRLFFPRADVSSHMLFAADAPTAFLVNCSVPADLRDHPMLTIDVFAVEKSGERTHLDRREFELSTFDYRLSGHGYVLDEDFTDIVKRDRVYESGPPTLEADPHCSALLLRYLRASTRVLDVGCGIGAYGRVFRERGRPWVGCEIRPDFVEVMRADGLDAHLAVPQHLPFEDNSFDAAIAIEVLEHIHDPEPFVHEMARVAPHEAYFSVPNFEAIPITSASYSLPWHMLEPDHWNFFSRASLKTTLKKSYDHVEVLEYGPLPAPLNAPDGLTVYNHLFAIARSAL
jgi:SAM-dependent methyltransferase